MTFNSANAYQYTLSIALQNDKLSYSIIDLDTKKSVEDKAFTLLSFKKEELTKLLDSPVFKNDYKTISLTVSSNRQTLIPISIFNASKPTDIFALNHQAPFDDIDYNRIPELDIVTIYEIPLWIKQLFVVKIPRIKIIHTSTALLKGIFNVPQFSSRIHIFWQNNGFYLVLTSKNKINYFNLFQSNHISDLVYHLLFILEQKELNLKDFEIKMYGVNNNWNQLKELSKLLNHKIKVDFRKEKAENFILTSQVLCV
ncbi:MAG TPA: DUF3822 family protein [Crocinitomix sp.]|nr:DUF3822 family protein [Crocinitomix sp.]